MDPTFTLTEKVWLWSGKASWHFVTIPAELSARIKGFDDPRRKGFRHMPVIVTIGSTTWRTSIFPEKKGTYLLPLKAEVRKKEGIAENDQIRITITLQ
ncbi:DUF1905 domain-containing protein [Candidatus Peregrinibacteria bacterium]|nr:DUF1905 domain-containing protein [Candidatus Peregrinibacteria bacterium]